MYFTEFQASNEGEQNRKDNGKRNIKLNDYFHKYSDLLNKRVSKPTKEVEAS
jgi:hypothetical protein